MNEMMLGYVITTYNLDTLNLNTIAHNRTVQQAVFNYNARKVALEKVSHDVFGGVFDAAPLCYHTTHLAD